MVRINIGDGVAVRSSPGAADPRSPTAALREYLWRPLQRARVLHREREAQAAHLAPRAWATHEDVADDEIVRTSRGFPSSAPRSLAWLNLPQVDALPPQGPPTESVHAEEWPGGLGVILAAAVWIVLTIAAIFVFVGSFHSKIAAISTLLARTAGPSSQELHFRVVPLSGGLESAGVFRVQVRCLDTNGRMRTTFVLKRLRGAAIREARIYEQLVTSYALQLAPHLLSVHTVDAECVLALEDVRRTRAWPWRSYALSMELVERLAHLHRIPVEIAEPLVSGDWDYEAELVAGARRAIELFESVRLEPDLGLFLRGRGPAIRQLAEALPEVRRQLLSFKPFGRAPIHGDVHAGNAIVRRRRGREEPVLLDWGRARIGSPLEDVSSFLQSVGYWEPEVRRRHDSLLAGYLSAYGWTGGITPDVRAAYWLAGASNAFAGALNYYFDLAQTAVGRARLSAARNAGDWLRVIRRAHAFWSSSRRAELRFLRPRPGSYPAGAARRRSGAPPPTFRPTRSR